MPNRFGDEAVANTSPGVNRFGDAPVAETPTEQPGFLSHLGSTLAGAPAGIWQTITHPIDALKNWRDQSKALHDAAVDSAEQGDYQAAAAHGLNFLANIIPGLGKTMDDAASAKTPEEFKAKLGDVVGTALVMKAGEAAPGAIKGTAKAVAAAPAKIGDFARTPGNLPIAVGTGQVAGGGGALLAGHPFAAGVAAMRGFENISKGMEQRAAAAAEAAKAEAPAPPPVDPMLDEIAQGMAGKKFASLDPAAQATVQKIAEAAKNGPAPRKGYTPPPAASPAPAPEAPPPAEAAVLPPAPQPAAVAPAPAPEPQTTRIPAAHEGEPAKDFSAAPRDAKVHVLADTMDGEIAPEDAARMNPGDWNRLADALGINRPSPQTVAATIKELHAREAARQTPATMMTPSPGMLEALRRPGALDAAQALQEEMNRSASADINRDSAATVAIARPKPRPRSKAVAPGDTVTTKNGKTGTVTAVNPNGTVDFQ